MFFDDRRPNIEAAAALGWQAMHVPVGRLPSLAFVRCSAHRGCSDHHPRRSAWACPEFRRLPRWQTCPRESEPKFDVAAVFIKSTSTPGSER